MKRLAEFFQKHQQIAALIVAGLIVAVLPARYGNPYELTVLIFIGTNAILTLGLNLVMGYAGQVSLGHATFFGLGAYTTGVLATKYSVPTLPALLAGVVLTAGVAGLVGIPVFRLKGNYLALATLGLNVIAFLVFSQQAELTGGFNGLRNIPDLALGPLVVKSDLTYYYLIFGSLLGLIILALNIVNSRTGRALRAIHSSEVAAEAMGINANFLKLQVFTVSAAFAGLAGGLYAMWLGFISPSTFAPLVSIHLIVMSAVGGLASVWGALFGAATITMLSVWLDDLIPLLFRGASGEQEIIAEGLILILIMIFLPEGLVAGVVRLLRRWWQRRSRQQIAGGSHVPA